MSAEVIYRDELERRSYAYGRMESRVRSALDQLQHGCPELAIEHLRLALSEDRLRQLERNS